MKRLLMSVAFISVGVGILWKICLGVSNKQFIQEAYPRLEKLMGVYSIGSWLSSNQIRPVIAENSEWGGRLFKLECPDIKWGAGSANTNGILFDCFMNEAKFKSVFDGSVNYGLQFSTSGDYTYDFTWESVFGYALDVSVLGAENKALLQDASCIKELKDQGIANWESNCSFAGYEVTLSGLRASKSFTFTAVSGWMGFDDALNPQRYHEWVFYIEGTGPHSLTQLNALIQRMFRQLGISSANVPDAARSLEILWLNKNRDFISALVDVSSNTGDLTKYIGGKK